MRHFGFQPDPLHNLGRTRRRIVARADQPLFLAEPILDFGLNGLTGENNDIPFEAILAEVGIEGESMVESVIVDQCKAGAIDKAEILIVVSHENRLGCLFNRFANTKHFDPGLVKTLHEFNGAW